MTKKWKSEKWKYRNIEMTRTMPIQIFFRKLEENMHAMIVEKKYTITNNN